MTEFIPPDEVQWRKTRIFKEDLKADPAHTFWRWEFELPEPLASWDVFDYWERERFDSMQRHLKAGMVLFDVGTEQGWCNLIYASFVGPENMVLIEPTPEFWPNIVHTWFKNYDAHPRAYYQGLLSDKTTDDRQAFNSQPQAAYGDLIDRNKYQYIHEHSDGIPEMRLDDLVERSGVVPDAITMDVEGAELLVLQGARDTLERHRPLAWVSVHPDLGEQHYGVVPADVHDFMGGLGYRGTFLGEDHEQHWIYEPL